MFRKAFKGEMADGQPIKVLIIGESHYEENTVIEGTSDVVNYLAVEGNDNGTQFYKNIMKTFGYDITPEQRKLFWSKVYFGNYVSELCGKRENNVAAQLIKKNKKQYNNDLFDFVNDNEIDIVFCFSRLVYDNLPSAAAGEKEEVLIKHKTNSLKRFKYHACIEHGNCDIVLKKPLKVFGLRHSSAGFSSTVYSDYLKDIICGTI